MPKCSTIKGKNRSVCVGDLNKRITIKDRTLKGATLNNRVSSENFSDDVTVWAMIQTTRGDQFFDGTSLRTAVTHYFYIRYRDNVTSENFIFFNEDSYDILDVEDLDENESFLKISARKRGTEDIKVNEA